MGFKTSEIGRLLNKSPQNISTVLGNLRKKAAGTEKNPQEREHSNTEYSNPEKELK
jgi:hypothetical protein